METRYQYTVCHGSGNRFVMLDTVGREDLFQGRGVDFKAWAAQLCASQTPIGGTDGLLVLIRFGGGYAMRMFNPDGSEAEMCGNGIRCAARQARKYTLSDRFCVWSGGREYAMTRERALWPGVDTYGAEIPVWLQSPDFGFCNRGEKFVGRIIPSLSPELKFTALSLGNPHITACVEHIDYGLLEELGERVKQLRNEFPSGINVSLFEHRAPQRIFVATYERGAGITASCGTAMTASATAAALLNLVGFGTEMEVCNRGGMVRCLPRRIDGQLITRLTGNATFEHQGTFTADSQNISDITPETRFESEIAAYDAFAASIR